MTSPRHPGSRLVDLPPNIAREIWKIKAAIRALKDRTRPEMLVFVSADVAKAEAFTSASMVNTLMTYMYRSGDTVYADVLVTTGAASVVETQLWVSSLSLAGTPVTSAAGGTERILRLTLQLPPAWEMGEARRIYVQARRVSGADATAIRVLRAWQR